MHVSRDVIFDKNRRWKWGPSENGDKPVAIRDFTMKYMSQFGAVNDNGEAGDDGGTPTTLLQLPSPTVLKPVGFASSLQEDEDMLDAFHDESPVRYRLIDNVLGAGEQVPGRAQRTLAELHLAATEVNQARLWRRNRARHGRRP